MTDFEAAFLQMLDRFGVAVTLTHRAKKLDEDDAVVKDKNGFVVYTETTVSTKCLLNWKSNYERMDDDVQKSGKYAIALFKTADKTYLNKRNEISYTDSNTSITYDFKIEEIIPRKTHIECVLS